MNALVLAVFHATHESLNPLCHSRVGAQPAGSLCVMDGMEQYERKRTGPMIHDIPIENARQ